MHLFSSIFSFILIVGLCLGCAPTNPYGSKMNYEGNALYYTQSVHTEQAVQLGDYLSQNGFFKPMTKHRMQLDKRGDTILIRLVTAPRIVQDKNFEGAAQSIRDELSRAVFGGQSVEFHYCTAEFETLKIIQ